MFPIGDENDTRGHRVRDDRADRGLNVLAFLIEIGRPDRPLQSFITAWGVVPREYAAGTICRR